MSHNSLVEDYEKIGGNKRWFGIGNSAEYQAVLNGLSDIIDYVLCNQEMKENNLQEFFNEIIIKYDELIINCNDYLNNPKKNSKNERYSLIALAKEHAITERASFLKIQDSLNSNANKTDIGTEESPQHRDFVSDIYKDETGNYDAFSMLGTARSDLLVEGKNVEQTGTVGGATNSLKVLKNKESGKEVFFKEQKDQSLDNSVFSDMANKIENINLPTGSSIDKKIFIYIVSHPMFSLMLSKLLAILSVDDPDYYKENPFAIFMTDKRNGVYDGEFSPLRDAASGVIQVATNLNDGKKVKEAIQYQQYIDKKFIPLAKKIKPSDINTLNEIGSLFLLDGDKKKSLDAGEIRKNNARIQSGQSGTSRDISTYRMAELLGVPNIIAETKSATIIDKQKNIIKGSIMAKAEGTTAHDKVDNSKKDSVGLKISANGLKDLCNLQVLDLICGQIDRHYENYFVKDNEQGEIDKITGIDNDLSFGLTTLNDLEFSDTNSSNLKSLPFVDKKLYETIKHIDPKCFYNIFADQLVDKTVKKSMRFRYIDALVNRFKEVKSGLEKRIAKAEKNGKKFVVEDWSKIDVSMCMNMDDSADSYSSVSYIQKLFTS